ncbi:hypothetical protein EWM64_g8909 [Hericium alpestre]|uniref:SH3 domain-containing protein n=1 Tax=Hericium alpestre TaxID=135208 RepID=A0A4Y9ZMA1_9AGAM|nr:hypothetical protein EWM64_g8909 [Hericium alpestre]
MPAAQLRIDTTIGRVKNPSSAKSLRSKGSSSNNALLSADRHLRSLTPTSGRSTPVFTSPIPSSSNTSTSSLHLPDTANAPSTSTSVVAAPAPHAVLLSEYVLAMHDFIPEQKNATCLGFRAGQVIHVLNRDTSGWWDGELDGKRGWFPSNYVNSDLGLIATDELRSPPVRALRPFHFLHLPARHLRDKGPSREMTTVHH